MPLSFRLHHHAPSPHPDGAVPPGASDASALVMFFGARFLSIVAMLMQSVAIGWDVYDRTHRALDLGYVGLAQFLPAALLSLLAGTVADRFERRRILVGCYVAVACIAFALFVLSARAGIMPIYALLVLLGSARAFAMPASQALLPDLVAREELARTVAKGSSVAQIGFVVGPALGGIAYGALGRGVYAVCALAAASAALLVASMRVRSVARDKRAPSWDTVLAGVRYVWREKTMLGAISLDLFAVLLGGAVALLPMFAKDVLYIGPQGLGVLRSAPAIGALVTGAALARWPLKRRAGYVMFACVALFGAATIAFGLSRRLELSIAALALTGAADMVSIVVRSTLVQIQTPEEMRGRVSAVNAIFIGASNELGELESGLTAAWLGAVPAVVVGGAGTLAVVALWAWMFPALREVDRLDGEG